MSCVNCGLYNLRALLDSGRGKNDLPDNLVTRDRRVAKGEYICLQGKPFQNVFVVKSGSFKSLIKVDPKYKRVVGFHLPGELIGLESVAGKRCLHTVQALEKSSICRLNADAIPIFAARAATLPQLMTELLSKQISFQHALTAEMVRESALQRVAAFLLSLSRRFEEHGLPGTEYKLTMSRNDIASFLGLASETVTRMVGRLKSEHLVAVDYKWIRLLDKKGLAILTDGRR